MDDRDYDEAVHNDFEMQEEYVDESKWITKVTYRNGLKITTRVEKGND